MKQNRAASPAQPVRLTPAAAAVAVLVLATTIHAQAQEQQAAAAAKPGEPETVIVTGIRASLQQSLPEQLGKQVMAQASQVVIAYRQAQRAAEAAGAAEA